MKQRIVIWGAVAALAVGVAGLVVVASGNDGGDDAAGHDDAPPRLPLDPAAATTAFAPASDQEASAMAIGGPITYVAGPDLPDLGGEEAAYRAAEVDAEQVAALAQALGVDGEPIEVDGSWNVLGGGMGITTYGPAGSWSAMRVSAQTATQVFPPDPTTTTPTGSGGDTPTSSGGGSGGAEPAEPAPTEPPTTVVCITAPCDPPLSDAPDQAATQPEPEPAPKPPAEPATVEPCPADPGGGSCATPACEPGPAVDCAPVADDPPAAGVPTTAPPTALDPGLEAQARDLVAELLEATGFDPAATTIEATPGNATVTMNFEPTLDGTPAPGLAGVVVLGADGLQSASGYFAPGDPLGTYPLVTTRDAIAGLNEAGDVSIMASPVPGAEPGVTVTAALPEPATEVVLTSAELVYLSVPSWEDSRTYVVPGYRLAADDGTGTTAAALAPEALRPPPEGGGD